jgi:L-amino acid N-acyltransferase
VDARHRGKRIGRALLRRLLDEADRTGFHVLLARIAGGNVVSLHLHESCGFRPVGVMHEVGRKFGRRIDVHLLERLTPTPSPAPEEPNPPVGGPLGQS